MLSSKYVSSHLFINPQVHVYKCLFVINAHPGHCSRDLRIMCCLLLAPAGHKSEGEAANQEGGAAGWIAANAYPSQCSIHKVAIW